MKEFNSEEEELAWFVGLVEGEGSFYAAAPRPRTPGGDSAFQLAMSDLDVIQRARDVLWGWDISLIIHEPKLDKRWKAAKQLYRIDTSRASYLKIIIDKTYDYFSEKKQSDCDRVLKNLADRGLL